MPLSPTEGYKKRCMCSPYATCKPPVAYCVRHVHAHTQPFKCIGVLIGRLVHSVICTKEDNINLISIVIEKESRAHHSTHSPVNMLRALKASWLCTRHAAGSNMGNQGNVSLTHAKHFSVDIDKRREDNQQLNKSFWNRCDILKKNVNQIFRV